MNFMVRELERLWRLTSAYRFVHRNLTLEHTEIGLAPMMQ